MTIERHDPEAGIKVVPMIIEGQEQPVEDVLPPVERPKTALLGGIAAALAALTIAALIVAMVLATAGDYRLSTIVAYGSVVLSVLAVLAGVVALILGRGRRPGIVAVVVGVLANPIVLLVVLRLLSGVQTG